MPEALALPARERLLSALRHQALVMRADWSARRYPNLEVELDEREEGEALRLRSLYA